MNNLATIHYLREGQLVRATTFETGHTSPQAFADTLAELAEGPHGNPVDVVQVWFGDLDGRGPDATAEVRS